MHRPLLVSSIALTALLAASCGSSPTTLQNHDGEASGGSQHSGGAIAAGGSVENGGALGTGGALATGGAPGTGGMEMAGGTGGSTAAGGTRVIPTGGSASGGSGASVSGGASSGGTGGSSGQGGVSARGGAGGAGGVGGAGGLPWLKVVGNQIQVEATGAPVILRGLSIEGLDQQSKDSKYNINGVIDLITNKNDTGGSSPGWYPVLLRLPVDSSNPSGEINSLLKPAVDYATKRGLYVIIDLHFVDNPYNNVQTVNAFWTTVAPMFKDYSNVIYEPFNESSVQDSWATYKPTMQAWVNLIRGYAPKNLIFAGSPSWDQSMGDAATNPLTGGNIVYVVHMYYHHWTTSWNKAQVEACAKVNPVVMTEWGYSNDSGETETDPDISATYGKPMLQWLEGLGGSWTAWCASNSWLPKMFSDNWALRVGPRDEGGFVKDWLYTNRNVKAPVSF
jgi:endoglucanase